jgi:hypothetical protein
LAHLGDGGLSWRPVIEVVLPPQWHQGHSDSRARAIMKREIRGWGPSIAMLGNG